MKREMRVSAASIALIPHNTGSLIKVDTATGRMTRHVGNAGLLGYAHCGGAYDGNGHIWITPQSYVGLPIIKVDISDGAMTPFRGDGSNNGVTWGSSAFVGGVHDGTHLWMVPFRSTSLVKVNTASVLNGTPYRDCFPPPPSRAGCDFDGWTFTRDGLDFAYGKIALAEDHTLYASWSPAGRFAEIKEIDVRKEGGVTLTWDASALGFGDFYSIVYTTADLLVPFGPRFVEGVGEGNIEVQSLGGGLRSTTLPDGGGAKRFFKVKAVEK